jgi:plasmid stabilization system protein ParE
MTTEQVAKAIGLIPNRLWKCMAVAENVRKMRGCADLWDTKVQQAVWTRGTGRSTEMMVHALVEMSEGKPVYISAFDAPWEHKIVRQLQVWAEKLELDPKLVHSFRHARERGRRPDDHKGVYVDHYLGPDGMGRHLDPRDEVGHG